MAVLALSGSGCATTPELVATRAPDACHARSLAHVRWFVPEPGGERHHLDAWCSAVGPPVFLEGRRTTTPVTRLAVLSWNVHVGGGDVEHLVRLLRRGVLTAGQPIDHFVLLLQEVHRSGDAVPRDVDLGVGIPSPIRPSPPAGRRQDIVSVAEQLGLSLYYVPSMRNGPPLLTSEDRGNAILSTLPLDGLTAVELPFERQRRVAAVASVEVPTVASTPTRLTLVSVHLDNLAGPRHGWVVTGPARRRQAAALLKAVPSAEPVVLAGDLNTWFGFQDAAYRELARALPVEARDRRATFGPLRLDYVCLRLPTGWSASTVRLDSSYGSDHYPLLTMLQVEAGSNEPSFLPSAVPSAIAR